jgi:GAF domain-containing protein
LKSEGEVAGVLALITRRQRRFAPEEVELLMSIGGQMGLAVRNAVLYARAQQRNRELAALLAVSEAATSSLDLPDVLDQALEAILAVTSAESAEVWLMEDNGVLTLERHRGAVPESLHERNRFKMGEDYPVSCPGRLTVVVLTRNRRTFPTAAGEDLVPDVLRPAPSGGTTVGVTVAARREALRPRAATP